MDLKAEDLFTKCPKCNGKKEIAPPARQAGPSFGQRRVNTPPEKCGACHGTGVHLTANGELLATFINILRDMRKIT